MLSLLFCKPCPVPPHQDESKPFSSAPAAWIHFPPSHHASVYKCQLEKKKNHHIFSVFHLYISYLRQSIFLSLCGWFYKHLLQSFLPCGLHHSWRSCCQLLLSLAAPGKPAQPGKFSSPNHQGSTTAALSGSQEAHDNFWKIKYQHWWVVLSQSILISLDRMHLGSPRFNQHEVNKGCSTTNQAKQREVLKRKKVSMSNLSYQRQNLSIGKQKLQISSLSITAIERH